MARCAWPAQAFLGRRATGTRRSRFYAMPWRRGSTISTPATSTGRMSPTNSSARHFRPYPEDLVIVTKVGTRRGEDASWLPAYSAGELERAVHDNLRNLGLETLEIVNLRIMFNPHSPAEGSIAAQLEALAGLQRQGLVRHIGLSNVTAAQVEEGRGIAEIVCVQNQYNLAYRDDDALIDALAGAGIAYVPFFPLDGFSPLQSATLSEVAARVQATPMQVALAWLLQRAPNILLIPGTSSRAHLRENLAAASLKPDHAVAALDGVQPRRATGNGPVD
jgi:pyridoxine 4-dehydrogenase